MKKWFSHLKNDYSTIEKLFLIVVCSLFFPYYVTAVCLILFELYLVKTKEIKRIFEIDKAKYLFIFSFLALVVSLFYQNYLGAVVSIGLNVIFIFILYVRLILHRELLIDTFKIACILSIMNACIALYQYMMSLERYGYSFFDFVVFEKPKDRATGNAFNANYYAMMIEFVLMICIYRLLEVKTMKQRAFYIVTMITNLMGLYFSGCRTAWVPILLAIPCTFFINKQKKLCILTTIVIGLAVLFLILNPSYFPRVDTLAYHLGKRGWIWQTAIEGIKTYPFFGQGPFTYLLSYENYAGPYTQHAHSLYLEPLLSYGIVLTSIFGIYIVSNVKKCISIYKKDTHLFSLIFAFVMVVLCHGVFDYTIFWIHTALLFFIVLGICDLKEFRVG